MKKLVLILGLTMMVLLGYSQATPFNGVRVANATTAFGVNVSIGTQVWDIGTSKLWQCTAASASTLTLTTGSANFIQIGGTGLGGTVTNVTGTSPIMVATGTTTPVVSINTDSLASWARRKDTATILLSRTRASHDYQAKGTYVTAVSAKLANVSGTTSIRIAPTVGIAKDSLVKMDSTASAGQIAVFSTSGTGLAGRSNASMASQLGVKTYKAFETEATVDSLTRYIYALSVTPVSTSVEVKINGSNLKATSQYTINGTKIYILAPIRTYDKINITCSY